MKEWRMPNSTWVELAEQSCFFIISIVYLPPGGTLAVIEKRILDIVKEGRPLIIGGDWNARVGKGWNGRGESTYNTRGKVLMESFKRLALLLPQLQEEMPVFTWRAGKQKSIVDYVVAWRWMGKVVGDGWQAWTDHRPQIVELKDSADNCDGVWMEQWMWKSYSEEDHKRRWREYKCGCKCFFKGEEWKAMVKKTWEGAATVEDLWSKWKKGLWDCAMRWFGSMGTLDKAGKEGFFHWELASRGSRSRRLRMGKAAGVDNIDGEMMKYGGKHVQDATWTLIKAIPPCLTPLFTRNSSESCLFM
ncbi:hypothetical protein QOT17_001036 [Balamuthia mandrillaris]